MRRGTFVKKNKLEAPVFGYLVYVRVDIGSLESGRGAKLKVINMRLRKKWYRSFFSVVKSSVLSTGVIHLSAYAPLINFSGLTSTESTF